MAYDNQLQVSITASVKGLVDGMKEATDSVKSATEQMSSAFSNLSRMVDNLKAPFVALTAVLGGGKLFKDCVSATSEWYTEVVRLGKATGVTSAEASVLAVALGDIGVTSDTYVNATRMLARQVATGAAGFNRFGIEVKDAHTGALKPANDIMEEALNKIRSMPAGLAQNTAGTIMFGKAWAEVAPLLRLNSEAMEEARERAYRLHLVVGPDGESKLRAYKKATNEVHDLWQAVRVQIGSQLMPVLTQFGEWLSVKGTDGVSRFVSIASFLGKVVDGLITGFESLYLRFNMIYNAIVGVGSAIMAFKDNMSNGIGAAVAAGNRVLDEYKQKNVQLATELEKLWADYDKRGEAKGSGVGMGDVQASQGKSYGKDPGIIPDKRQGKEFLQQVKDEWELRRATEKNGFALSLQDELEFWESKLALARTRGKDAEEGVQREINTIKVKLQKQQFDEEIAQLHALNEEYKGNGTVQIAIAETIAERTAEVYGSGSKEAINAQRELAKTRVEVMKEGVKVEVAAMREAAEAYRDDGAVRIAAEEQIAARMRDVYGAESVEYLTAQRELIKVTRQVSRERLEAEIENLRDRQVINKDDGNERLRIEAEIVEKIKKVYGEQSKEYAKAVKDRDQLTRTVAQQQLKEWSEIGKNIGQNLGEAFASLATGAQNVGKVMANMLKSILQMIYDVAVKSIMASAAKAAAEAAVSQAGIPIVGPALAIGAMSMMFGAVMALIGNLSAAGGFDIPAFQNPIVQTHAQEMILPAKYANPLRDFLTTGKFQGVQNAVADAANQQMGDVNLYITHQGALIDKRAVQAFYDATKNQIANSVRKAARNGRLTKR